MVRERLKVMGLSHHTAPVEVRERFSFDDADALEFLRECRERLGLGQFVLLSTCNRTETYFVEQASGGDDAGSWEEIAALLAEKRGRDVSEWWRFAYRMHGKEAIMHLYRVASSLDSLVIGEPQILGQVKGAYRTAMDAGTAGSVISMIFERAFKVAKQVRSTTRVGTGGVSVGSVAVDLARKVFGDLGSCKVLLLGAGKMAEAVAKTLSQQGGSGGVTVANRTVEKARKVASQFGWRAAELSNVTSLLNDADIVIASLSYPGFLVGRKQMREAMAARRHRPVFVVDIGVPRVVDPEISRIEGAYLYDIDDFNQIVGEHMRRRMSDVERADAIVDAAVVETERRLARFAVQPTIALIRRRAIELKEREMARAAKGMAGLDEEQLKLIDTMATSIVDKLIQGPIKALKASAEEGDESVFPLLRRMFDLDEGRGDG